MEWQHWEKLQQVGWLVRSSNKHHLAPIVPTSLRPPCTIIFGPSGLLHITATCPLRGSGAGPA